MKHTDERERGIIDWIIDLLDLISAWFQWLP